MYCAAGTDQTDCRGQNPAAGIRVQMGNAPVPNAGQGAAGQSVGGDTCRYAKDGRCDVPFYCAPGTDQTDCGRQGSSQSIQTPTRAELTGSIPTPGKTPTVLLRSSAVSMPTTGNVMNPPCAYGTDGSDCD